MNGVNYIDTLGRFYMKVHDFIKMTLRDSFNKCIK